ncbi:hypothetical protein BD309DRAFT_276102 [Dichomitus squalens]|nr:hypothetical protein BD309DRAFT_276102 [Dichomitus squalens]
MSRPIVFCCVTFAHRPSDAAMPQFAGRLLRPMRRERTLISNVNSMLSMHVISAHHIFYAHPSGCPFFFESESFRDRMHDRERLYSYNA